MKNDGCKYFSDDLCRAEKFGRLLSQKKTERNQQLQMFVCYHYKAIYKTVATKMVVKDEKIVLKFVVHTGADLEYSFPENKEF